MNLGAVGLLLGSLLLLAACGREPAAVRPATRPQASADAAADVMALGSRFVHDSSYRRWQLEASLVNRSNGYSQVRLAQYRPERWGSLPVARFRTRPVRPADLGQPPPIPDESWATSGGEEALPPDAARLRQLGERLFHEHPAQIERSMLKVLRDEAAPSRYGLWRTSTSVGGMVWVALPGGVLPAFTCSTCHSSTGSDGALRAGVPNHRLDLGRAKDDYSGARSLYSTWGPGRVDLAADGQDNPVVIGDVRAARFQTHLHRTANVINSLPALAVRVETGLITAHRQELRPTPADAFALAYYLYRLGDSLPAPPAGEDAGAAVFRQHCGRCHRGPGLSGPPVPAASIASPVARMPSAARGTGSLQTPSLRGVSDRGRLLFGGDATGLEELLDPARRTGGHSFGQDLGAADRQALVAYLRRL
ncbi:MAG TPA: cytochrome c [Polyangiaceae bacterium]|nr:cytochrome c [Polyangiaceae bacterium]